MWLGGVDAQYVRCLYVLERFYDTFPDTMASERPEALRADFVTPFANPALWSVLYHAQNAPFVDVESFGWNQPGVRRAAWSLLQVVLAKCQGSS